MENLVAYLQTGVTLTTPIFFVIVLIVLLRSLRMLDLSLKTLVYLQSKMDKMEKASQTRKLKTGFDNAGEGQDQ